jgi:transcription elongation factor GreB
MNEEKNYITPSGLEKLKQEYHQLFHVERPKLVETIAWAASNGDRSENADYIYGKRRLREIDKRLGFLSHRLEKAFVVDPSILQSQSIVFGATVTVQNEEGETSVYQIVGEDETNVMEGKISWKSPLARALLGKKAGDETTVQKPAGEEIYSILEVKFQ